VSQAILLNLERDDYSTPQDLFNRMNAKHGPFDLDAAASHANAKCAKYYTRDDDALNQKWEGVVWCNPPWKELIKWTSKALEEVRCGNATRVVMYLPVITKARWFHENVLPMASIEWIQGGVKFGGAKDHYVGSVMIVIFA
jgi:phage N-6-adenine-methyltransferase